MYTKERRDEVNAIADQVEALSDSALDFFLPLILISLVSNFPLAYFSMIRGAKFLRLHSLLKLKTKFLDEHFLPSMATRVYYAILMKSSIERCLNPKCNKPFTKNISILDSSSFKYMHCNTFCALQNPVVQNKIDLSKTKNHTHTADLLERTKQRNNELYGCDWYFLTKEFEEKKLSSWNANGYDHPMHSDKIKEDMCCRYEQLHGVKYAFLNPEVVNKIYESNMKNYGVKTRTESLEMRSLMHAKSTDSKLRSYYNDVICKYPTILPLFSEEDYVHNRKLRYEFLWKCKICGNVFKLRMFKDNIGIRLPRCYNCRPKIYSKKTSNLEKEIFEYISTIKSGYKYFFNSFENWNVLTLLKQQLDIICVDESSGKTKIAFEIDGIYWHLLKFKGKHYHLNKTKACERMGIKLVHIWEDEWLNDNDRMKKLIRDVIEDNVHVEDLSLTVRIPRDKFNKCFQFDGYKLVEETDCNLRTVEDDKDLFIVEDCGMLVYERK